MASLVERYRGSSPALAARLEALAGGFPSCRRVEGDGNCFYRGFVFGLLEALLEAPHPELHARWAARGPGWRAPAAAARGVAAARSARCFCARGRRLTRARAPRHARRLLQRVRDTAAALAPAAPPGSDAARGGELLASLLARVWYAAPAADAAAADAAAAAAPPAADADAGARPAGGAAAGPLFVPELEAALARSRGAFDPLVQFARLAASLELRSREAAYAPFLAGCGEAYAALPFAELCARHVERMGQEVEQLQMAALAAALGVGVGVLDVAGSEAGMVKHPAGEGEPLFSSSTCRVRGALARAPSRRRARPPAACSACGAAVAPPHWSRGLSARAARPHPFPPSRRAGHYEICYRS